MLNIAIFLSLCGLVIGLIGTIFPARRAGFSRLTVGSLVIFVGALLLSGASSSSRLPAPPTGVEQVSSSNWAYREETDTMRKRISKFWTTDSENTLDFSFPYAGGSKVSFTIKQAPGEQDIYLEVSRGQFTCGVNFSGKVTIQLDDGPLETADCSWADDGRTDKVSIFPKSGFLQRITHAHKMIIEAPFYQAGSRQITFKVEGLS